MSGLDVDFLPEDFWQRRHSVESKMNPPSLSIYHDVDVVGGCGFPIQNGDSIVKVGDGFGWSASHIAPMTPMYAANELEKLPLSHNASGKIDVLLSFPGGYTYGHWPVDIAARIERAIGVVDLDRLAFIVPGPQQSWMRFHLDAYDIKSDAIITVSPQQRYRSATLAVPLVRFSAYLPPYPHVRAFARLKAHGFRLATQRGNYGERIFVRHRAQTSGGARNVLASQNETEIGLELEKFGFLTICPADMTLDEQISAFADAKYIIGEASSALHNVIYANNANLIVLNSPSHKARLHLSICKLLGHSCKYLFGKDSGNGTFSCSLSTLRDVVLKQI